MKVCRLCKSRSLFYDFTFNNIRFDKCNDCNLRMPLIDFDLPNIFNNTNYALLSEHIDFYPDPLKDNILIQQEQFISDPSFHDVLKQKYKILFFGKIDESKLKPYSNYSDFFICHSLFENSINIHTKLFNNLNFLNENKYNNFFDCIIINNFLESVWDFDNFLNIIYNILHNNGVLIIKFNLFTDNNFIFKKDICNYLNTKSIKKLLYLHYFHNLSIDEIRNSNQILVSCNKKNTKNLKLSIVMAAYNEANTIQHTIEKVLNKLIDDLEIELIIVESNSTDNTRNIVNSYLKHPRVKVLFEDFPSGKGHAIAAGLSVVTGDFILIQDADDEYDIDDYDILLKPLITFNSDFILGSRHGGGWRMRKFANEPFKAFILNFGHWVFTLLVNVLCCVRLKDPFTMYKVFRKDCIQNMTFTSKRFDFDLELLIKLIRRGYIPIEIPVNYRSRSFSDGKKVKMIRDPISWIIAIIKFRFFHF